ncbi:MAG: hypothetical protein DI596_06095 [Azospira oryzae]|nr:MAG: hypothetical protein DI596_06095 [Azospira oryzae]PZP80580.1 MAG: hypothetical protein DI593_06095 [Azospira oryzae]
MNAVPIGTFVRARVPFQEGDGRYKIRPVLILGRARTPKGDVVYIGAAKFSSSAKVRGEVEVILTDAEARAVGLEGEGVLRFSRQSLVAFLDQDVISEGRSYKALPNTKALAIENAARAVRFPLA